MANKYTKLNVSDLDILQVDPNWTEGPYPIDTTAENDQLIGLEPRPDDPIPVVPADPISIEPFAAGINPFDDVADRNSRPNRSSYPRDIEDVNTPLTASFDSLLPERMVKGVDGKSLLKPFLNNTTDHWITPPDLINVGGFIGKESVQSFDPVTGRRLENYLKEESEYAEKNQLQPSIRLFIDGNSDNLNTTWDEMLSYMELFGLDVKNNTGNFFATKRFSYQPPIDSDKFSNFRYFYWVKNIGKWDVNVDPDNEHGLILTNGSLIGFNDFVVNDYVRIDGVEFKVVDINTITSTIKVIDETNSIFLGNWKNIVQVWVGHDKPAYYVQKSGLYITNNGWINNNFWKHVDTLTGDELTAFSQHVFLRAEVPIIELDADVVIDETQVYSKIEAPNVKLFPLQYVAQNRNGFPIVTDSILLGYNPDTTPILSEKIGVVPFVSKPIIEYMTGSINLDGTDTVENPYLQVNVVKLKENSDNYIYKNGLIDTEFDVGDIRRGRFYVYLKQIASSSEPEFIENKYLYKMVWEPTIEDEISSTLLDSGEWDIAPQFRANINKETPEFFELEDLNEHFLTNIRTIAKNDVFLDGKELRLHPTAGNNFSGTIFYYGQELNWWISLMLQPDSSPLTILRFARQEYQVRIDSIRGIIYKIASDMSKAGYTITLSQFRQLFLRHIQNLNLGAIPNPFFNTSNIIRNFISTPAHFGLALAEQPAFIYDHIRGKLAYSGILGEVLDLPFGTDQLTIMDLFYHEVQMMIYDSVPDQFKSSNSDTIDWNATRDVTDTISLTSSDIIRTGVYRLPAGRIIDKLEKVTVKVNSVVLDKSEFLVLDTMRDIAFNRYSIPGLLDTIDVIIDGYSDPSIVPNPFIVQAGKQIFDIRNYVYNDISDKTLIRCYTNVDLQNQEQRLFYDWLKRTSTWQNRNINPFGNDNNATDSFTWNYKNHTVVGMPAMWYEIYEQYFYTSGPQYEPWTIQGYTSKPTWWDIQFPPSQDGLYPYPTMWNKIQNGIKQDKELLTPTPGFVLNPAPTYTLPINTTTGELLPPYSLDLLHPSMFGTIPTNRFADFVFGDNSPTEMEWRNSSDYKWDVIEIGYFLKPIDFISLAWDSDRVKIWNNGLYVDKEYGKISNHKNMVFFGQNEEIIQKEIIEYTYDFIGDGFTNEFSGQGYSFGPIEIFDGNGLQTDFVLENAFIPGDYPLVEVDGNIVVYGVDYVFIDTDNDGNYETIRFTNAPGSFTAKVGREWDTRINSLIPITNVVSGNSRLVVSGNYNSSLPSNLVFSVGNSTANDGLWTVLNSFYNGSDTIINLVAPNQTYPILKMDEVNNEFWISGNHANKFAKDSRFFVTGSAFYNGRWIIEYALYDGVYTHVRAKTLIDLSFISADYLLNTIHVKHDVTEHATVGTDVLIDVTSGRNMTWKVLSSSYDSFNNKTDIVLDFPVNSFAVTGVDQTNKTFTIDGYQLHQIPAKWDTITISSSPNAGVYTVSAIAYNDFGNTVITVVESIPSATVSGTLVIDGTFNQYNLITGVQIYSAIDTRNIVAIDNINDKISIAGDYTSVFTATTTFDIKSSVANDGTYETISSSYIGSNTVITIVSPRVSKNIVGVNTGAKTFSVSGDYTAIPLAGTSAIVSGSSGNNGTYTIVSATFNGTNTVITVVESIPSSSVSGSISLKSRLNTNVSGFVSKANGTLDGTLDSTVDGQISNDQQWQWDIVGWDDISVGVAIPTRVRIGSPAQILTFDENDQVDVYIDGYSTSSNSYTTSYISDTVTINTPPVAFSILKVIVYNPRDIIERPDLLTRLKLTNGLNQWYSQFYLYRGKKINTDELYSLYWKNWEPHIIYRTNSIINPQSISIKAFGDLILRRTVDYNIELDRFIGIRDFFIDSFFVTVAEKTETSFDTVGQVVPSSTLFNVKNFDRSRNYVKTAVSRKDMVYRFTVFPPTNPGDAVVISGIDNNSNTLSFRANDEISVIIGTTFYSSTVNAIDQSITLSNDAVLALSPSGTTVAILVEPLTRKLVSHDINSASSSKYKDVKLVSDLINNTGTKSTLNPTEYIAPLEFEINADGSLKIQEVILPAIFTAQELITFIFEYERYLLDVGGVFDELEGATFRNWVLMVDDFMKYVDTLEILGESTYEERSVTLNVLKKTFNVGTRFGFIGEVSSTADFYSNKNQDLLDVNGLAIPSKYFQVTRQDGFATINLVGDSVVRVFFADKIPFTPDYDLGFDPRENGAFPTEGQIWFNNEDSMFYYFNEIGQEWVHAETVVDTVFDYMFEELNIYTAHIIIDKFESIIRFEDNTSTERSIYKPLTGKTIKRVFAQFEKARIYNGRPNMNGFALVKNETTGLLEFVRNIESQIVGQTLLYDKFNVPLDNNFDKAIPDLLGLVPKDYLKRFVGSSSPRSLIGFQQGLIQQKGARDNINAFVEAIRSILKVDLYEVWAYKVAEYGDNTGDDYIVVKLTEKEGSRTILGIQFTDAMGVEKPDPVLVEVKENDTIRFPYLKDEYTTKDGSRFYFPVVKEGSVSPEWYRDWVQVVKATPNNFSSAFGNGTNNSAPFTTGSLLTYTSTNIAPEIGYDFGTIGVNAFNRLVRLAGATLVQSNVNYATKIAVEYHNIESDSWIRLGIVEIKKDNGVWQVEFPFHNISAKKWKLVAVEKATGTWELSRVEFHKYAAKPDYSRIGEISAYDNRRDIKIAQWYPFDPLEGYYTPEAFQYVDHNISYDPAIYTNTNNEDRKDSGRAWGEEHVGEIWWDKSDYGVIDYKNSVKYPFAKDRASIWGKIASGKKVSIYEWVKSSVPPSSWADIVSSSDGSEKSLTERVPSGIVRNTTDYTINTRIDSNGNQVVTYYFWVSSSDRRGYTKDGKLRSLNLKQIASALENPNTISQNKFYIIDNYMDATNDWHPNKPMIPERFTQWFGNGGDEVFTSDFVDLHFNRKFLLENNLEPVDFRSNRHEEWILIHAGQNNRPNADLWDDMVAVLFDENAPNEDTYNMDSPTKMFMPRDALIRLLNKKVLEIKPDFFPEGFESASISGQPTFEKDTPFSGAASVKTFDIDSTDPYRNIRSLGETSVNYFDTNLDQLKALMSRDNANSFYNVATIKEVNTLFFTILEEALAFDRKKSNVFKTSWIAYDAIRILVQEEEWKGTLADLDLVLDFINSEAKPFHTHINADISRVTLTAFENMNAEFEESYEADMTFIASDLIHVETRDSLDNIGVAFAPDSFNIEMMDYLERFNETLKPNENLGVLIEESLQSIIDIDQLEDVIVQIEELVMLSTDSIYGPDSFEVSFIDSVDYSVVFDRESIGFDNIEVNIIDTLDMVTVNILPVENIDVGYLEESSTTVFGDGYVNMIFNTELNVQIEESFTPIEHFEFSDNFDVGLTDGLTHINIGVIDYMVAGFNDVTYSDVWGLEYVENTQVGVVEILHPVIDAGPMYLFDQFDSSVDETLRVDIMELDPANNWYYGFYMIHDGGQNQSAVQGSALNGSTVASAAFVGLEPGLDSDPSSEDWYRWDGAKFKDNYYVSSFDNFSDLDYELLGYDLEQIGRIGYNWDGVGNNTINSSSITGRFIRSRPMDTIVPITGEVQFTHIQTLAATIWFIPHYLGYVPIVRSYLNDGTEIIPRSVVTTANTTILYFNSSVNGTAKLV